MPGAGGETPAPQTSQPAQPSQAASPPTQQQPGTEGTQPASQGARAKTPSPAAAPSTQPGGAAPAQPAPEATPALPQPAAQPAQPAPGTTLSQQQPGAVPSQAATSAPSPPVPQNVLAWQRGAIVRVWPADTDPDRSTVARLLCGECYFQYTWLSKKGSSGPFTFVFELPAEATIDRLGFQAGSNAGPAKPARVVHAAVSTQSADAGFADVGTFTLKDTVHNNVQDFPLSAARAARWIRVTVDPRPDGQTALGGVLAYGQESAGTTPATLSGIWLFDDDLSSKKDPLFGPSGRLPAAISLRQYLKEACGTDRGCGGKTLVLQVVQSGDHFSAATCRAGDFAMGNELLLHGRISGRFVRWKSRDGVDVFGAMNAEGTLFVGKRHNIYTFIAMKVSDPIPCATSPSVGNGKKVLVIVNGSNYNGKGKEYKPFGYPDAFPGYRFVPALAPLLQGSDLAGADSVVFDMLCKAGTVFDEWQQGLLLDFVKSGHKLIIADADWCGNQADYAFLPYPFTTSNPGAQGAKGHRLILVEPSSLGTDDRHDAAHFTDLPAFVASSSQQLGDANIVTTQDAHWCGHLFGTNALHASGFSHMYARYGSGLIIYNGFDTDDTMQIPTHQRLFQLELAQPPSAPLPCTQSVAAKFIIAPSQTVPFVPGQAQSIPVHLEALANLGYTGTVSLSVTPPESTGWDTRLSTAQVTLTKDTDSAPVDVTIGIPATATRDTYTVTVTGSDGASHTASAVITLVAQAPAPAPVVQVPPKNVQVTEERCRIRITVASGILFDFDKDNLKPGAAAVLAEAKGSVIDKHPGARVTIEGHTDDRGTQEYNLKLSARRAQSVAGWLSQHGIKASLLQTVGYGKMRPRYPNTTDENRARNRRVEIVILTCPGP